MSKNKSSHKEINKANTTNQQNTSVTRRSSRKLTMEVLPTVSPQMMEEYFSTYDKAPEILFRMAEEKSKADIRIKQEQIEEIKRNNERGFTIAARDQGWAYITVLVFLGLGFLLLFFREGPFNLTVGVSLVSLSAMSVLSVLIKKIYSLFTSNKNEQEE